jgi:hypothetical protein
MEGVKSDRAVAAASTAAIRRKILTARSLYPLGGAASAKRDSPAERIEASADTIRGCSPGIVPPKTFVLKEMLTQSPPMPPAPDASDSAPTHRDGAPDVDSSPYHPTTERPPHLHDWQLPKEWQWGAHGVFIGQHRHTQQVIDPLGRTLSLVTAPDPAHRDWLTAEARALGNRRHRAIPTTYVYWPRNDLMLRGPGYVRHWIDGWSLATQLRTQGPDTVETSMTRLRSLGSCLVMLHENGETHGALNCEGAWMTRAGEHYLLGWQWALPPAALPPGKQPTLQWVVPAPEWLPAIAARGRWWVPTPATDQFQLGALIVASITGRKWGPDGEEALGALEAHVDVPRSVRDVLRRATATDPDTRFPSVAALLQTLDRAIGGESSLAGLGVRPVTPAHETDPATAAAQQEARLRAATGLDYELRERLGHGASGAVWKARDLALNREVALKALHPEIAQDPRAVSRLRREARLVASLAHPRIVPVLEFAERSGVAYFTMPLTPGGSLADLVATRGPLPLSEVGPELEALLDGVSSAHAAGWCTATSSRRTSSSTAAGDGAWPTSASPPRLARAGRRGRWPSRRRSSCAGCRRTKGWIVMRLPRSPSSPSRGTCRSSRTTRSCSCGASSRGSTGTPRGRRASRHRPAPGSRARSPSTPPTASPPRWRCRKPGSRPGARRSPASTRRPVRKGAARTRAKGSVTC